jgi:hypothetical protein
MDLLGSGPVAGSRKCGDEPSGFGATTLLGCVTSQNVS